MSINSHIKFSRSAQQVVFISLVLTFLISCSSNNSQLTDLQKSYIQQPAEQTVQERIWKEISFSKLSESKDYHSNITGLHFDNEGGLFLGDRDQKVIKKFNLQSIKTSVYGEGRGSGPGEFRRFFKSIFSDRIGNIWVMDEEVSRITRIQKDTGEWDLIPTESVARHAIPIQNGYYVLDHHALGMLAVYSNENEKVTEFDPYLDKPANWQILMQSSYAVGNDYNIIRAMYFTNDFIRYKPDGSIIYFRRPVKPLSPISVRLEDNPNDIRDKPEIFRIQYNTIEIRIRHDQIHFLISELIDETPDGNLVRTSKFVDVYDLETGDYQYSYRLPEPLLNFAVYKKYLAGITEESGRLVIWEVF